MGILAVVVRRAGLVLSLLVLTGSGAATSGASQSPSGREVVYSRSTSEGVRLFTVSTTDREAPFTTGQGFDDIQPDWAPDGDSVAFVRTTATDSAVMTMTPGGEPVAVTPPGLGVATFDPTWSPDGSRIAFVSEGDLNVVASDGGRPQSLTETPDAREASPTWAPDGSALAFVRYANAGDRSDLFVVGEDGVERRLTELGTAAAPEWSPAGDAIAFDDGQSVRVVDAGGGAPRTLAPGRFGVAWSPDAARLAVGDGARLFAVDADTGARQPIAEVADSEVGDPVWSDDGRHIAFVAGDNAYSVAVSDGSLRRLNEGGVVGPGGAVAFEPGPALRLAGSNRVATAAGVSRGAFPSASAVVVASAGGYADGLAAAPLAAQLGGPVLLSGADSLSPESAAEVSRLSPDVAYVVGGSAALSPAVDDGLREAGADRVVRLAGATRYDTARLVAERLPAGGTAFLVEGANPDPARGWPDAVSASVPAAVSRSPILLVERDRVPAETQQALRERSTTSAVIVGGEAAVSSRTQRQVEQLGITVERAAGADRYETSVRAAEIAVARGAQPDTVWLATGSNWPDALAAGPAAASEGVLLLAPGRSLADAPAVEAWLRERSGSVSAVRLVGGPDVLSADVQLEVNRLIGP